MNGLVGDSVWPPLPPLLTRQSMVAGIEWRGEGCIDEAERADYIGHEQDQQLVIQVKVSAVEEPGGTRHTLEQMHTTPNARNQGPAWFPSSENQSFDTANQQFSGISGNAEFLQRFF